MLKAINSTLASGELGSAGATRWDAGLIIKKGVCVVT